MSFPRLISSPVRSGCLFLAAALFTTAAARAESMTYNIVDYPTAEIDQFNSEQDKVTGTITISALGSYTPSPTTETLSYDITLSNADGSSYSWSDSQTVNLFVGSGTATFTSSEILLSGYLNFSAPFGDGTGDSVLSERQRQRRLQGHRQHLGSRPGAPFRTVASHGADPAPWVVAIATPEPATMTLVGSAALTLVVAGLRLRRGRKS